MRTLTKQELQEFEKTFNFLNFYVGAAANLTDNIHNIRINQNPLPNEIIKFVNSLSQLNEVEELGIALYGLTPFKKVNILFNEVSKERKEKIIQRLIRYCFNRKLQPSKLRVIGIHDYSFTSSYSIEKPIETVFESSPKNEIDYDDMSFIISEFGEFQ